MLTQNTGLESQTKYNLSGGALHIEGTIEEKILDRQLKIAIGKNKTDTHFINVEQPLGKWLQTLLGNFQKGEKDGVCILQGAVVGTGGRRTAKAMTENCILMLDIDTGVTIDELEEKLGSISPLCLLWTTHSHGTKQTQITESSFHSWATKNKIELNDESLPEALVRYLREVKKYKEAVLDGATYGGRQHGSNGVCYCVNHMPLQKFRLLFLLKEPFSFSEGGTQEERIKKWKKLIENVSDRLDVPYDTSCVDPSRPCLSVLVRFNRRHHRMRGIHGYHG